MENTITIVYREDYDDTFYYVNGVFVTRESQDGALYVLEHVLGVESVDETDDDTDPFAARL